MPVEVVQAYEEARQGGEAAGEPSAESGTRRRRAAQKKRR